MRRIGIGLFSFLISISSAYAGNAGFYGGISGGWGDIAFQTKYNIDSPCCVDTLLDKHSSGREFVSELRVGYANGFTYQTIYLHWWDRFHWEAEVFYEPTTHTVTTGDDFTGVEVSYHTKLNYGFVVKPGLQMTLNTTLNLILGVVRADFSSIETNTGDPLSDQFGEYSKSDTGWRIGLGLEGRLNRHMSLELAAFSTFFSNKPAQRILNPPLGGNSAFNEENLTFHPRTNQILLNFNWYLVR